MKKQYRVFAIIAAVILLIFLYGKFGLKIGSKHFKTYEEFRAYAPVRLDVGIPDGAENPKFFYKNTGLGYSSFYAFTLKGNDYQSFINNLAVKYNLRGGDTASHGYSKWYGMTVSGIVANPNTGRIVVYNQGNIR